MQRSIFMPARGLSPTSTTSTWPPWSSGCGAARRRRHAGRGSWSPSSVATIPTPARCGLAQFPRCRELRAARRHSLTWLTSETCMCVWATPLTSRTVISTNCRLTRVPSPTRLLEVVDQPPCLADHASGPEVSRRSGPVPDWGCRRIGEGRPPWAWPTPAAPPQVSAPPPSVGVAPVRSRRSAPLFGCWSTSKMQLLSEAPHRLPRRTTSWPLCSGG